MIHEELSKELDSLIAKEQDLKNMTITKTHNHYERLAQGIMANVNFGVIKKQAFSPKICKFNILVSSNFNTVYEL